MLKYHNCSDTIVGPSSVATVGLTWRQWLGKGVGVLLVDTPCPLWLLVTWQKRSQDRFELATLDDRTLKDLGISRSARDWEVAKPFWRA